MNIMFAVLTLSFFQADFSICTDKANQLYTRALWMNNQFYVFWADYRYTSDYALFGARILPSGKVLDPDGKRLYKNKAAYQPAVASDGKNILAVFRDGC